MDAAFWGLGTALGWGFADFFARYTARGFGTALALAAMLLTSSVILSFIAHAQGELPSWQWEGFVLLLLGGLGILAGTALLYWGLARGPVSLVSPIVASYPAFNLALAVAIGIHLTVGQWALIALVMAGVITVSKASKDFRALEQHSAEELTKTVVIAIGSALCFAAGLAGLQLASPFYGEWGTLVFSRWIGALAALAALLVLRPARPAFAPGLGALLLLQGMLDGGAYLSLLFGSEGAGAAIVVVVASCFSVITMILARLILKERMSLIQKFGVAMVIGGVAGLSYLGAA